MQTLMLAISALANERRRILERSQQNTSPGDDEHLAEQVLDIGAALSELAHDYEARKGDSLKYPSYEGLTGHVE
jgi:hypothetical protein